MGSSCYSDGPVLAWVVAPLLGALLGGEAAFIKALLLCITAGLIWQFVLTLILTRREQGTLRWSRVRNALWLLSPREPRSGRVGGRVWLWVIPFVLLYGLWQFFGFDITGPSNRDFTLYLDTNGEKFFRGAWGWFAVLVVQLVFNSVLGQDLLFRGLLLPRMRGAFGRWDWVANGVLFAGYHLHQPWSVSVEKIRVLVADDHPFFRDGLRTLLESAPDTEFVGETERGGQAIAMAEDLQPDVILMDMQMPDGGSIEATRRISRDGPQIRVLIVTMFEDDATVFQAMRAGARGYLLKGANTSEMLRAIRAAGNGEAIFSPKVAVRLMDFFSSARLSAPPEVFPELSEREREILDLIAQGHKNPEIAADLYLSPKTVRNHVSNILRKLQVADRAEAIIRAREAGLG